ncbi:MAG: HEAT repeat domain-containing protein [bacterium]
MKRVGVIFLSFSLALFVGLSALAQEKKKEDVQDKKKKPAKELRRITPEKETDFREFERSMEHLEHSLRVLEHIEIPELPVLAELPELPELPELHIEIPEIHIPEIEIPEMHFEIPDIEIPEIEIPPIEIPEIVIPDIEMGDFHIEGELAHWNGEWQHSRFRDLSDEEELRVQALRSVAREDDDEAMAMIEKVLQQDESAAVRYQAVRLLRRHLKKDKTIDLLGATARNDKNAEVKKAAIRLLGKSGSPRAVEILQEIVRTK